MTLSTEATISRLQDLKEVVENTPDDHFDMEEWVRKTSCGTVGCILGNAALAPKFKALGFDIEPFNTYDDVNFVITLHGWRVASGSRLDTRAIADVLGLDEGELLRLFMPINWDEKWTRQNAIKKIDALIDKYRAKLKLERQAEAAAVVQDLMTTPSPSDGDEVVLEILERNRA